MDRKSRRARKLAASGVTVLGLAAALAVTAPTAANAQHSDHNCGNFQYNGQTFGAPTDGHHRHRGAFHTAAHGVRLDPVDDHSDHDGDRDGDHRDGDHDGDHSDGDRRDADHHDGDHSDRDHSDRDGDHHDGDHHDADHHAGDRDGDHRDGDRDGDHRGDRDNRWGHEGEHRYASDARGDDYVNDGEGNYNCGNFGYHGKQMYVPHGLFDGGDEH